MSDKDKTIEALEALEAWRKEGENLENRQEEMREKFLREVGQLPPNRQI
ncbi:hypothetical protein RDV78_05495 [Bacillota bacterium LX-D]|nr:hypothetical protein [Bacillota bacterium LX-D]